MSVSVTVNNTELERIKEQCTVDCIFAAKYYYDPESEKIEADQINMKGNKISAYCHIEHDKCLCCVKNGYDSSCAPNGASTASRSCRTCGTHDEKGERRRTPYVRNELIVPFSLVSHRPAPKGDLPFRFKFNLRNYQKEDLELLLPMIYQKGSCMFQAECGYGKTVVIAFLTAYFKTRTILLVPNEKCGMQNASLIEKAVDGCTVAMTKSDGSFDENADILIAVTSQLKGRLGLFDEYETVIFDEIHLLSKPHSVPGMLSVRPKRLIGFTATPEKKEDLSRLFVGNDTVVGSHRMRWSIVYLDVPFKHQAKPQEFTKISTEMAKCQAFINMVTRLCIYFFTQKERVMILTERNDLRDSLTDSIEGAGVSVSNIQPKTQCENADVIIGNKGMISTGFDLGNAVKNFDGQHPSVVIFGFTLDDKTLFKQSAGRAFRSKYPLVIFPRFSGWASSKKHTRSLQAELANNSYCTHRRMQERMLQYVADGTLDPEDPYDTSEA